MAIDKKELVEAGSVPDGCRFRKERGETIYLKVSNSAVKWLGLDHGYIYGVCTNGNICKIEFGKLVVPISPNFYKLSLLRDIAQCWCDPSGDSWKPDYADMDDEWEED